MAEKVNIVLVHGAWGDGSHWRHVIPTLHNAGHRVVAVQNPLTSLADDVDRTRKVAESMDGPTLLVGHSYGGAVITGAGHAENVVGLVYIAAFAPDEGDSLGSIFARTDQPAGAANIAPDAEGFLWIAPDKFQESFSQDLDDTEALVMALTQKPIAGQCFSDPSAAGMACEAQLVSDFRAGPNDSAGNRAMDGRAYRCPRDRGTRRRPCILGVPPARGHPVDSACCCRIVVTA